MPQVEQRWRDEIRAIHSDWDIEWDRASERFRVVRLGHFKGRESKQLIYVVAEDDGSFRQLDQRTISHLREQVWRQRNAHEYDEEAATRDFDNNEKVRQHERSELEGCLDDAIPVFRRAFSTQRKR